MQAGSKVTLKVAGLRLVMRDVLRRPLAELEVGQVLGGLSRPCATVIQARTCAAARGYNSMYLTTPTLSLLTLRGQQAGPR